MSRLAFVCFLLLVWGKSDSFPQTFDERLKFGDDFSVEDLDISFLSDDPLIKYIADHSLRLTLAQKRLIDATLLQPDYIMLSAPECIQLNSNLMKLINAEKVLDIGTYTGSSALSAALSVSEYGTVFTFDITEEYYQIGKPFIEQAGVESKIRFILGPASESLDQLISDGQEGTFDFSFIDADKIRIKDYYEKSLTLLRSGGIIALDNTLWRESVVDRSDQSQEAVAIRELNNFLKDDSRIDISFLQCGDGFTLAFKK